MAFMRKKYLRFALVFCALAYAGAVGSAAFRIFSRTAEHKRAAAIEFKELVEKATAAASLGFMEEPFRDAVRQSFEESESLAALIVTGPSGPEYAVEREGGYLESAEDEPRFSKRIDVASDPLIAPLRIEIARNAMVSAARIRIYPAEMMSILSDSMLIALVSLLASLVILLFSLSKSASEPKKKQAEGERPAERQTEEGFEEEFEIPEISAEVAPEFDQAGPEGPAVPTGLYGPDGVLGWEEYLQDRLEAELKRAASFEQDLVLLVAEADIEEGDAAAFKSFAQELVDFFSFRDLAFRRGETGAAVILPNIDLENGIKFAEEFMTRFREKNTNLEIGLSARAGRLVDSGRLLIEAQGALERARGNGDYQILGFKPDPERYRTFVSSSR